MGPHQEVVQAKSQDREKFANLAKFMLEENGMQRHARNNVRKGWFSTVTSRRTVVAMSKAKNGQKPCPVPLASYTLTAFMQTALDDNARCRANTAPIASVRRRPLQCDDL